MLNAFTDEERAKLAALGQGGGTTARLSTLMSADLVLDGTEQIIAFDPAQTGRAQGITINVGGTFTVNEDGYFNGDLSLFADKSGGAGGNMSIWIEIKPLATGIWQLASPGMSNPIVFNDGGVPVALAGSVDALAGDEFRIKIKKNGGTVTLRSEAKVVSLGTITNFAAALSVYKVGPVTV